MCIMKQLAVEQKQFSSEMLRCECKSLDCLRVKLRNVVVLESKSKKNSSDTPQAI